LDSAAYNLLPSPVETMSIRSQLSARSVNALLRRDVTLWLVDLGRLVSSYFPLGHRQWDFAGTESVDSWKSLNEIHVDPAKLVVLVGRQTITRKVRP
jgi:hypothetical protein